jgi:chemotaxis protein CheD
MATAAIVVDPPATRQRIIVGIGEYAVSNNADALIVTHALGSCIAVCLWDPDARVGGLLHVLLPDSRINETRAEVQPAAFADTGVPLLFRAAYEFGVDKKRCRVRLIGGADMGGLNSGSDGAVGKRNLLAVRKVLWRNGIFIERELVGGHEARSVAMAIREGRIHVTSGGHPATEL